MRPPLQRQGHNWHVAEDVRAYVERVDREERAQLSGHYFETLEEQLDFLRAARFRLVDCFWKNLDLVLIGGYR